MLDDILGPQIAEELRKAFREGNLPSPDFLRRCEAVGMRAIQRRKDIQRIRAAAGQVPHQLTLADYIMELVNAAGVDELAAKIALGLDPDEGWETLNQPTPRTKRAAELLDVDEAYVERASRMPDSPAGRNIAM